MKIPNILEIPTETEQYGSTFAVVDYVPREHIMIIREFDMTSLDLGVQYLIKLVNGNEYNFTFNKNTAQKVKLEETNLVIYQQLHAEEFQDASK
jgi:hypothetical protein